jgi:hypothetical protein
VIVGTGSKKPPGKPDPKNPKERKPWYRRIYYYVIAAIVVPLLVGVLANKVTPLIGGSGGTTGHAPSAGPVFSRFISPAQRIVRVYHMSLDGGSVPEVAITTINGPGADAGPLPTGDLLLLAWDKYARRWFVAYDVTKDMGPITFSDPDASMWALNPARLRTQTAIPFTVGPKGLVVSVLRDQPGSRADLLFWSNLQEADGEVLIAGIVHYDGQTANLAWSFSNNEGGSVSVVGSAPHQKIAVSAGWEAPTDAHCCPVRTYRFTVARTLHVQGLAGPLYQVVNDDRPWLGAYIVAGIGGSATGNAEVVSVVPGSPAAGVLHPMDVLTGVVGTKARRVSVGGPAVIDELASHYAGDTVQLQITRGGKPETVTVKLASRASPKAISASASYPGPNYFGADTHTLTRQLARKENLPTMNGAVISRINTHGGAARAGLAVGDVITSFNGLPIHDSLDLAAAVAASPAYADVPISFIGPGGKSERTYVIMTIAPYESTVPYLSIQVLML